MIDLGLHIKTCHNAVCFASLFDRPGPEPMLPVKDGGGTDDDTGILPC